MVALVSLFFAGLLAGAEVVVRYGVRGPIAVLDEQPQLRLRQALIRSLRIVVPAIFVPTAGLGIAVAVLGGTGAGWAFRWAAVLALLAWSLITFTRTVPINQTVITWRPDAPPADWRSLIDRWERLNTARTWAAVAAFGFLLAAAAPGSMQA